MGIDDFNPLKYGITDFLLLKDFLFILVELNYGYCLFENYCFIK
jgi:hypothetical protein